MAPSNQTTDSPREIADRCLAAAFADIEAATRRLQDAQSLLPVLENTGADIKDARTRGRDAADALFKFKRALGQIVLPRAERKVTP